MQDYMYLYVHERKIKINICEKFCHVSIVIGRDFFKQIDKYDYFLWVLTTLMENLDHETCEICA